MTKKQKEADGRLRVKLQSFYRTGDKEAHAVFNALDWAYTEADDNFYGNNTIMKTLARLRDLAAVSIGKPTLAELEEENY